MSQRKFAKNLSNVCSVQTNPHSRTPPNPKSRKSPLTVSKCSCQTSHQVSYGELQIVLQNLQNIKQKASSQVQQLTQQNESLTNEINKLQKELEDGKTHSTKEISRYLELEEEWESKERKWIEKEQQWIRKVKQLNSELEKRERKVEDWQAKNRDSDRKIHEAQVTIARERETINQLQKQIEGHKQKWRWAFDILAGNSQQGEDLIWKVKSQNYDLWALFTKENTLTQQVLVDRQRIESLTLAQEQLKTEHEQTKAQHKYTTLMLDKSLNELHVANQKISQLQQQIRQYCQQLSIMHGEKNQLQNGLQLLNEEKTLGQNSIQGLQRQIKAMCQEVDLKEKNWMVKQKRKDFQSLIGQICDQTEDYSKVLERVRYLQRFHSQHYYNVQKIQFLCRLLDS